MLTKWLFTTVTKNPDVTPGTEWDKSAVSYETYIQKLLTHFVHHFDEYKNHKSSMMQQYNAIILYCSIRFSDQYICFSSASTGFTTIPECDHSSRS